MNERDIFLAAIEISDQAERTAYIKQACGDDAKLRAQVDELLKTHEETSQFLETHAAAIDSVGDQTILTNASDTDEDSDDESASGEAEFRKYLEPATRDGWLGRLAHYEIEQILGRGAFGIVAKAFDEKLHRVVAIKLMSPELASTSPPRKRFLREARTAAAVTHENIVAIHAVEEEPIPYLVMEYISGETLQQRLDGHGPLEIPDVLRIGQQVASGMAAAHAANLIHRDIKPSNILLTEGPHERAKISDFGLARAVDDASMTSSGMIAGTPMYMAPEQAQGETLDHRADLFSLGSVLYQMTSGRPPFRAANTVAVLKRVCEDRPRPLDDVIPGIPDWLETIIFKLLEKNRDSRYQTAQEVADLLVCCQSELKHEGKVTCIEVPAGNAPTQVFRPQTSTGSGAKKNPFGWLLGGVTAVAVVIGLLLMNGDKKPADRDQVNRPGHQTPSTTADSPSSVIKAGWHGWPDDAPPPAIAPFDTDQAKQYQTAWAEYLGVPVEYENSIGMKFRLIPPGEFLMGATSSEIEFATKALSSQEDPHYNVIINSGPPHKTVLTKPFYLGTHEVTQSQCASITGSNPSQFSNSKTRPDYIDLNAKNSAPFAAELKLSMEQVAGKDTSAHPVDSITWMGAAKFLTMLNERESLVAGGYDRHGLRIGGTGYHLPTEAQWEFACRAGSTTRFWSGNKDLDLTGREWASGAASSTSRVGLRSANSFGLHDMLGNVQEFVEDEWDVDYFRTMSTGLAIDPQGAQTANTSRIVRGGHFKYPPAFCMCSSRYKGGTTSFANTTGFRATLSVEAVRKAMMRSTLSKREPAVNTTQKNTWHGWPADAPSPAIAPFDAAQARKHQEAWAKYLQIDVEYTNSIGMKFMLIPPGEFLMGSTLEEIEAALKVARKDKAWRERINSEAPQHKVVLTKPVYVSVTEVTQAQYEQVMGTNPSHFSATGDGKDKVANLETSNHPVEMVSWNDAAEFCAKLSQQEELKPFYFRSDERITSLNGTGYRLPTEAEWESACRAGTTTRFWSGDTDQDLISAGRFGSNSGGRTHVAGELKANPFGLSDIHGNVFEWVQDSWDPAFYGKFEETTAINPSSPFSAGYRRVLRGGVWDNNPSLCRSSYRLAKVPIYRYYGIGFRVVLVAESLRVSRP